MSRGYNNAFFTPDSTISAHPKMQRRSPEPEKPIPFPEHPENGVQNTPKRWPEEPVQPKITPKPVPLPYYSNDDPKFEHFPGDPSDKPVLIPLPYYPEGRPRIGKQQDYPDQSAPDTAHLESYVKNIIAQYDKIRQSVESRYADGYNDAYRGDAATYADAFAAAQVSVQGAARYLLGQLQVLRGTYGDEWTDDTARNLVGKLSMLNNYADTVNRDATWWSRFSDEADYGAQMFASGAESGDDFRRMMESKYPQPQRSLGSPTPYNQAPGFTPVRLSSAADPGLLEAQKAQEKRDKLRGAAADPGLLEAQREYDQEVRPLRNSFADVGLLHAQQFNDNKNQYGININALLKVAESQLNTKEGYMLDENNKYVWTNDNPYGSWYKQNKEPWCAQFASWVGYSIGSLNTDPNSNSSGIPKNQSTSAFISDYKTMNRYAEGHKKTGADNAYKPKAGDFIFTQWYDTDKDGNKVLCGHTAIVVAFDENSNTIYTISGNSGSKTNGVYYNTIKLTSGIISGYGINGGTSYGKTPDLTKNQE